VRQRVPCSELFRDQSEGFQAVISPPRANCWHHFKGLSELKREESFSLETVQFMELGLLNTHNRGGKQTELHLEQ
jgi:hypothetical protein